jgi:hypothetical protein
MLGWDTISVKTAVIYSPLRSGDAPLQNVEMMPETV